MSGALSAGRVKLACERSAGTYRGMSREGREGKAAKIYLKARNDEEEEKARTQTSTKKCGCPFLINVKENATPCGMSLCHMWEAQSRPIKNLDGHSFAGRLDKGSEEVVGQMTKGM
ncbi:hypothetical protein Scep_026150 [Stephania cephalantha]|uniref:Uncharacterized protein n=1 Tax=Stephania cephalantha TaxID=152367 RepID=A0AAP0HS80_9MAGN